MKNLLYTFRLKNKKKSIITSIIIDTREHAYYVISRLVEEGMIKIKTPLEIVEMEVIDYDC